MAFNSSFTLDRQYLEECFDQSLPHSPKKPFRLGFTLGCIGIGMALLFLTELAGFFAALFIGLGMVEILSFRFRRAWWLARQLISRSANCEVKLCIDDQGVASQTSVGETKLSWQDIQRAIDTPLGLILETQQGQQSYLSKSALSDEAQSFIQQQIQQ